MSATTFDTHAALRALTRAGVAAEHAEAITDTVRVAVSEGIAAKADIADIAALDAKIAALETRLTVRMVALGGAIVAVMAALKLFG